jgi:hypothetical protein
MATAAKFVLPIPIFLAYLVPLDVDVAGNITAKLCEVWSEFNDNNKKRSKNNKSPNVVWET